jgi:AcrR family transcriptional regulator
MTEPRRHRRADRHLATKREILDAAWSLARERGLGGWSLRDVADAVGMRAPSLYGYFASKNALYDAMFAEGYAALLERTRIAEAELPPPPRVPLDVLRAAAEVFFTFCVEDPARYQLLFLRTLPGFEPSPGAYALARESLDGLVRVLDDIGLGSPEQVDLWTALLTGLASQQVSNDPGGSRWRRLVDPAVEMFAAVYLPPSRQPGPD